MVEFKTVVKAFEIVDEKKKEFVAALSAQFINIPNANENFSIIRDFYAEDFFSRAQSRLNIFLERGNLSLEDLRSEIVRIYNTVFNDFNIRILRDFPDAMTAREHGKDEAKAESTDSNSLKDGSKEKAKNKRKAERKGDAEEASEPPRKKWKEEEGTGDKGIVTTKKRKLDYDGSDAETIIMDTDALNDSVQQSEQKKKKSVTFNAPEEATLENAMSFEEVFYKKCLKFLEKEMWRFHEQQEAAGLTIEQKKYIENAMALLTFFGDFILDLPASSSIEEELYGHIFILEEKIVRILKKSSYSQEDCQNFAILKNIIDVLGTLYLKNSKKDAKNYEKRMEFRKTIKYDHLKGIKRDLKKFFDDVFEEEDLYEDDSLEDYNPDSFGFNPLVQSTKEPEEKNADEESKEDELVKKESFDNYKSDGSDFWIQPTKGLGYQKTSNTSKIDPSESDIEKIGVPIGISKNNTFSNKNNMVQAPMSIVENGNFYTQSVERAISSIEDEIENFSPEKFEKIDLREKLELCRNLLDTLKGFDDEVFEDVDSETLQTFVDMTSPGLGDVFAEVMMGSMRHDSIIDKFSY